MYLKSLPYLAIESLKVCKEVVLLGDRAGPSWAEQSCEHPPHTVLWGGVINQPPDPKQTLVLGDFRKSVVVPGWAGPQGGGSLLIVELTPREPLLWWCKVHGSCCCVCLPWLEERRRWSSRRNGDLLSSYGQTKPPFSVPKQHPCPCRASHLELGKLRVADREGIWAIANTLGQTEEHDCVCCSLSRVKVGAPALLGWQ